MKTKHPNLTTQRMLYVEISRACDRSELVTDDRAAPREQLEAATGERIAALEAVGPEHGSANARTPETGEETGRGADRKAEAAIGRAQRPEPELERVHTPRGFERDMGL